MTDAMPMRPLGRTGLRVPALGFGAFKIGRNVGTKYPTPSVLPDEDAAGRLLHGALDLGLSLIDTAPAYGESEARIGRHLAARRSEFVLVSKVGEEFEVRDGRPCSRYDFTPGAVQRSVEASVDRLRGPVDVLLVHADDADLERAQDRDLIRALEALRARGLAHHIGFSGKRPESGVAALTWAEVLMIEYSLLHRESGPLLDTCASRGVGVLVKKALASGRLESAEALPFALAHPAVDCVVVGGSDLEHVRRNACITREARS